MTLAGWLYPMPVAAQRVTGSGQQASAVFSLPAGLAVFEIEHHGSGTFVVRLLDDRGALVDTLVRATGPFRGSKATQVPRSGAYLYDVVAGGAWTIALRPAPAGSADTTAAAVARSDAGAGAAPAVSPAAVSTGDAIRVRATVDAEQAARQKGAGRWMIGGLAGGALLGPLGAGLAYVAANKGEPVPSAAIETRRAAHGDAYAEAFSAAYQAKRRSDRRVAALVGGATGTVVFGFVIAQIVNWSRESGGKGGPGGGELP